MKKLILPLLLFVMGFQLNAQNNLTIFSETGESFYLILNGIRQNENPETNVFVDGLTADYYTAKVIFNNSAIPEIDKKTLYVTGDGCRPCDATYKIKENKKGEIVMKYFAFTSKAMAPPPPPNVAVVHYNTVPMPAPVIGFQVTETTTTTTVGGSDNVNVGVNMGGFNMGVNVNINDGFGNTQTTSSTTTTTTTTNMPTQQVVVVEQGCTPMNEANFSALMGSVQAKDWDESKLTVAKQATAANCLTANQIKRVMGAFEWEDAKLDYAKFAHAYCFDPQNYYLVNDAFEWDDNVEELNNYIR